MTEFSLDTSKHWICFCISFLGPPWQITTKQATENIRKFPSHSLEARCPKSRCWQGHPPSGASKGGSFLTSSSCWRLLAFLALWPPYSSLCLIFIGLSPSVCLGVCVSLSFLLSEYRSPDLGLVLNLRWCHLEILNYICKDPCWEGHIYRYRR